MKRIGRISGFDGKVVEKVEGIVTQAFDPAEDENEGSFTNIRFTFTDGLTYSLGVMEPDYEVLLDNQYEIWEWYENRVNYAYEDVSKVLRKYGVSFTKEEFDSLPEYTKAEIYQTALVEKQREGTIQQAGKVAKHDS